LRDEPLGPFTWLRVGGPAELLFLPADEEDLASLIRRLPPEVPVTVLGAGSNVIVRDGGIRGLVVRLVGRAFGEVAAEPGEGRIIAGAAALDANLARAAGKAGVAGLEFFAGIPGTVGGALAMNAGAWDGETWRHVIEVDVIDRRGIRHTRPASDYAVSYRQVKRPADEWFIATRMEFERRPGVNDAAIKELLERRKQTQPIGEWSCGSVFTNPPGRHAGRLIEESGLKGFRIGDASVSEKHANFIINHGAARAADIEALILHVQRTVAERSAVELKTEVRIVGDPE